jgi:hypothetical protein
MKPVVCIEIAAVLLALAVGIAVADQQFLVYAACVIIGYNLYETKPMERTERTERTEPMERTERTEPKEPTESAERTA